MKKKSAIILSLILVSILLAWFVMAAAGDDIFIETQLNGTNWSGGSAFTTINISFDNATDVSTQGQPINVSTIYINQTISTGKLFRIANNTDTTCIIPTDAAINASCTGNYNISSLENGTLLGDGEYTLMAALTNSTTLGVNMSKPLMRIKIDNTEPATGSFVTLTSGNNHSFKSLGNQNLTLNISVSDFNDPANNGSSNISSVTFFLINQSGNAGNANATVKASREGTTGSYWSTSVDTRSILDARYNITVLVNDTAGNFNRTLNGTTYAATNSFLRDIVIDNTAPTITHSCTPNPVAQEGTLTCTCSGGDGDSSTTNVTSGVNSTSFTANPSTTNSGPGQTTSCTVIDRAGNTATNTFTYTVSGASNNGGSSGGSSGGSGGSGPSPSSGSSGSSDERDTTTDTGTEGTGTKTGDTGKGTGTESRTTNNKVIITTIIVIITLAIAITFFIKRKK
jgi:hypothetical protein